MSWFLGELDKDPQAVADTGINWDANSFLANRSTTISTSTWAASTGLTVVTSSNTTTSTRVRISGGTEGARYELTNHVVLANGEEYDRTIIVNMVSQ